MATFDKFKQKKYYDGLFVGSFTDVFEKQVTKTLAIIDSDGNPPSVQERIEIIEALFDAYIEQTGKVPSGVQVQRLANWLLLEELRNNHPDKVSREEYPFLSKRQLRTRYNRELANETIPERYTRQKYLGRPKQPLKNN